MRCIPPAVFAMGLNYLSHAKEVGAEIPKFPIVVMKNPSSVLWVGDAEGIIKAPPMLMEPPDVDYEGELAIVIGETCKNVSRDRAYDVIEGFSCALDMTARRWQGKKGGNQWCFAKSFDTFCPIGSKLFRPATESDLMAAEIKTTLNNDVVQQDKLGNCRFPPTEIIAFLSQGTTLLKGTTILTGTPAGVGFTRKPTPRYLKEGDKLQVEIGSFGKVACRLEVDK